MNASSKRLQWWQNKHTAVAYSAACVWLLNPGQKKSKGKTCAEHCEVSSTCCQEVRLVTIWVSTENRAQQYCSWSTPTGFCRTSAVLSRCVFQVRTICWESRSMLQPWSHFSVSMATVNVTWEKLMENYRRKHSYVFLLICLKYIM